MTNFNKSEQNYRRFIAFQAENINNRDLHSVTLGTD